MAIAPGNLIMAEAPHIHFGLTDGIDATVESVLGLVRDLLSPAMRNGRRFLNDKSLLYCWVKCRRTTCLVAVFWVSGHWVYDGATRNPGGLTAPVWSRH